MKDAQRIAIFGASGSGKSYLAAKLIKKADRLIVFDPLAEYERRGFVRCETLRQVLFAMKRRWSKGFKIAYIPPAGKEPAALHELSRLLRQVQEPYFKGLHLNKITLLIEEMNTSFYTNLNLNQYSGFAELCSRGRHYGIELIGVSQRLAEVNTRFRGNCNAVYFFRMAEHRDIATCAQVLGTEYRAKMRSLPRFHHIIFTSEGITEAKA